MDALRRAHDDVERRVATELDRAMGSQEQLRRDLQDARDKNVELQKDLDKMTTQKNYVQDAFEAGRKEITKIKTEASLKDEEIARLRKAVEDLQADRTAHRVEKEVVLIDFSALEVERDVLGRALGAATKALHKKRAADREQEVASSSKGKVPPMKKVGGGGPRTAAPRLGSPRIGTPTGGISSSSSSSKPRASTPMARAAWN